MAADLFTQFNAEWQKRGRRSFKIGSEIYFADLGDNYFKISLRVLDLNRLSAKIIAASIMSESTLRFLKSNGVKELSAIAFSMEIETHEFPNAVITRIFSEEHNVYK